MGNLPKSASGSCFDPAGTEPDTSAIPTAANDTSPSVINRVVSARDDAIGRYKGRVVRFRSSSRLIVFMRL